MRTIGVVTGSRADYGIYRSLLNRIVEDSSLKLALYVTGMHLCPQFGSTVKEIEKDGFNIAARIENGLNSDTPEEIAKSMGLGTVGFAQAYSVLRPDLLVVLGDRFEMHSAALAALPFNIPLVHIHGGELSQGAFDDALRHSITKLSHLHCVATEVYAHRVIQLGEEPWRVTVCGALSLDTLRSIKLLTKEELEEVTGLSFWTAPIIVTFHPVTLEYQETASQIGELLTALEKFDMPLIFTLSNADTYTHSILQRIRAFVQNRANACLVENLGTRAYFSLMAVAAAMVGNSSSGIIEAMSFHLPVVNVGARQDGRMKPENVIDVSCSHDDIVTGIRTALSQDFQESLRGKANLYERGNAAKTIVTLLKDVSLDARLIKKGFADAPIQFSPSSHC